MTFSEYIVRRLNGRKWVVARKSPRLVAKGYEVFFSQEQFKAIDIQAHSEGCTDCFWGSRA